MITSADLTGVLVATLGGAAIGLERQWSGHADGPRARFAGIRTFTMLGALAGLSGWLFAVGLTAVPTVLLAAGAALVIAAYVAGSRQDIDGTTEVAALVVLAAGAIAGMGQYRLASGVVAFTSLLLVEKTRLHAFAARLDQTGLRAGVRFAVMALVILPLLPAGPYGPWGGVRPRELWALVLFFSGLSYAGYLARILVGASRGYFVTGLLGGLVSSTNVTFTFARMTRASDSNAAADRGLAFGAIAANAMLFPRVLIAVAVLNLPLVSVLAPYLAPAALVAIAIAALGLRRAPADATPGPVINNPLQLGSALQMAFLFQAVLFIVHLAGRVGGTAGVLTSAAVLGFTDVDALTVSMARGVAENASLTIAAAAVAIGILSNTVLKCAIALTLGSRPYRVIAGSGLMAIIAALVVTLITLWP